MKEAWVEEIYEAWCFQGLLFCSRSIGTACSQGITMVPFVGQEASPVANYVCFMRIFSELMFAGLKTRRRISRSLWMNMRTSNRRPWRQKLIENIPKVGFVEFVGFPPRPTPKPFINLMWMKAQDSVTFSVENGLNGFWIDRKCRRDWRIYTATVFPCKNDAKRIRATQTDALNQLIVQLSKMHPPPLRIQN